MMVFHKMNNKTMMKRMKLNFVTALGCWVIAACFLACSSSDEDTPTNNVRKLRQLTIADAPLTRVTLTDNETMLGAIWNKNDVATYLNMSQLEIEELVYGNLTASKSAETTTLVGTVFCMEGDLLAVVYPAVEPAVGDGSYTIDLDGQKGTLDDIAQRYHYVFGVAEVEAVTDNTATAFIQSMQPLLAVCKFTFKDEDGNAIPVKTLDIIYDNTPGYPLSATVTPAMDPSDMEPEPNDIYTPLSITLDSETSTGVYVALFPGGEYSEFFDSRLEFSFMVTGSQGTYTGKAKAVLNAGRFYPVSLKMTLSN